MFEVFALKVDSVYKYANLAKYLVIRKATKNWRIVFQVLSKRELLLFIAGMLSWIGSLFPPKALTSNNVTFIFLSPFISLGAHYTVTSNWKFKRFLLSVTLNLLWNVEFYPHSGSLRASVYICFIVTDGGICVTLRDWQSFVSLPDCVYNDRLLSSRLRTQLSVI